MEAIGAIVWTAYMVVLLCVAGLSIRSFQGKKGWPELVLLGILAASAYTPSPGTTLDRDLYGLIPFTVAAIAAWSIRWSVWHTLLLLVVIDVSCLRLGLTYSGIGDLGIGWYLIGFASVVGTVLLGGHLASQWLKENAWRP